VPALKLLSGGAAHGLVAAVAPAFTAKAGCSIDGTYGAVGIMAGKLREGEAVDVMILTAALIAQLAKEGLVVAASIADIGVVETAHRGPRPRCASAGCR
jgi:molybdate transport system substrate-binding protein